MPGRPSMFDVHNATASPRHRELHKRYERVYTLVDFAAAMAFVVGSLLFFFESQRLPATWAFLVGSILFAARPTVAVVREFHLSRLPLPGETRRRPVEDAGRTSTAASGPTRP